MSTAEDAARKRWRERNSDFVNSWHDAGLDPSPTHTPPAITEETFAAESLAFAGALFPLGRLTPDADGEQAHAVRFTHTFDPTLDDPDAE